VAGNLSDLLKKNISFAQMDLIQRVADEASLLELPIYIVGGFVRDLLLGHPGLDYDLVIEGDAIRLADSLASKYGGKVTVHEKFGTAKWYLKGTIFDDQISKSENRISNIEFLDLISARSETYKHPAALPTVKMGASGMIFAAVTLRSIR